MGFKLVWAEGTIQHSTVANHIWCHACRWTRAPRPRTTFWFLSRTVCRFADNTIGVSQPRWRLWETARTF
jgi:hypothetical protein